MYSNNELEFLEQFSPLSFALQLHNRCAICYGRFYFEKVYKHCDEFYHIDCLVCSVCHKTPTGDTYYGVNDQILCRNDYLATLDKCHKCRKPIEHEVSENNC
jgi:hypothetical protein